MKHRYLLGVLALLLVGLPALAHAGVAPPGEGKVKPVEVPHT
jgi:hypothetical protein